MEVEFNDFLSQLGRDTVSRIKKEQPKPEPIAVEEEVVEEKTTPIVEDVYIPEVKQSTQLDEDFFAQALDYANIVLKSVRGSFDSKEERKKVCESIRNAMNFYLNESNPTPIARAARAASKPQNQMSEEDWNKVPTIQKPEPIIKNETTESVGYQKTDTNMTMNADNSVNLSHLTTEDMSDFRTLAGIT